jgi:hypothetical protein
MRKADMTFEQYQQSLAYNRQYRAAHREQRRQYQREYDRKYRLAHLEKQREYDREWKIRNPDKVRSNHRKEYQKKLSNPKHLILERSIQMHKARGCIVKFTKQELYERAKDVENCEYCEKPLDWSLTKGHMTGSSPTIDRINNANLVMTLDNIMISCNRCNAGKFNRPLQEFIDRFNLRNLGGKIP